VSEEESPVEGPDYRVLVIDDHPLLATAVSMELQARGNVACQIVHTGEEAVATYVAADQSETAADAFDLVLSDMDLDEAPDSRAMSGIDVTRKLLEYDGDAKVVILTASHDRGHIVQANKAGAVGYITKDSIGDGQSLTTSVLRALRGERVYTAEIASVLIADSHGESAGPNLTDRELQVLQLIAQGLQFKEIASKLLLSTHTVRDYARSLFSKLDVNDRAGAVAVGFKTGILT